MSHNITVLYPNPCYNEMCDTGTALYLNTLVLPFTKTLSDVRFHMEGLWVG